MRVLIIHQNFPGQFRHVAAEWARRPGWEVIGIGRDTAPGLPGVPGLKMIRYKLHRRMHPQQHHYMRRMEDGVLHGQAVARVLLDLKRQGFVPDAILAHPGWGETLYAKDVFPSTRLVHYAEWFYNASGADIGFDPEFPATFDDLARIRTWNAIHLLNLQNCDAAISPTHWQKAQHPVAYLDKITVAHEGIDTENLGPDASAMFKLPTGQVVRAGDPVITYVARNLEPYRGFHTFMRALPAIQKSHPTCQAIIVGGDDVSYGSKPKEAVSWRERMLREVGGQLDASRTHFLGRIPYLDYKRVLQVSAAHLYLTYPFVLSWSALEAMASGCLMVASDTAPVREVLANGRNGLLVPGLNPDRVAEAGLNSVAMGLRGNQIRARAEADVCEKFQRRRGFDAFERLLGSDAVPKEPNSNVVRQALPDNNEVTCK